MYFEFVFVRSVVHDIGVKENNLVVSYTNKLDLTMLNTLEP